MSRSPPWPADVLGERDPEQPELGPSASRCRGGTPRARRSPAAAGATTSSRELPDRGSGRPAAPRTSSKSTVAPRVSRLRIAERLPATSSARGERLAAVELLEELPRALRPPRRRRPRPRRRPARSTRPARRRPSAAVLAALVRRSEPVRAFERALAVALGEQDLGVGRERASHRTSGRPSSSIEAVSVEHPAGRGRVARRRRTSWRAHPAVHVTMLRSFSSRHRR